MKPIDVSLRQILRLVSVIDQRQVSQLHDNSFTLDGNDKAPCKASQHLPGHRPRWPM